MTLISETKVIWPLEGKQHNKHNRRAIEVEMKKTNLAARRRATRKLSHIKNINRSKWFLTTQSKKNASPGMV
ncbi:hypothetical protein GCM10007895_04600 [Paraferrimonas sedimenticola]|uniref:Uncharacterized protein n=1 Tax=Paraferrimonas sedimenticola TaxID=375674 RepID=A0AA37VT34_9GAMM|nr:hypothetical protein GCM10007895_04600 [Paraferrimonas sedimenticola]